MPSIALIVPCYNEANRIAPSGFIAFANEHSEVQFYFVNDGSNDNTEKILLEIQQASSAKIISLKKNSGKANAVREGLLAAMKNQFDFIGYLDADLSTSFEEFLRLKNMLIEKEFDFVLGSRIKKIDTVIQRSFFRHIVGRVIASLIDQKFKLGVYDTQCGAKIFRSSVLKEIIDEHFFTKWFFDVEILLRIKNKHRTFRAAEVALSKWHSVQNSKLNILSFPSVLKDLFVLLTKY